MNHSELSLVCFDFPSGSDVIREKLNEKMINKLFLVVSLFCLLLYLFGILTSIVNVEENDCKMTYMFEYPQFIVS